MSIKLQLERDRELEQSQKFLNEKEKESTELAEVRKLRDDFTRSPGK